MDVIFVRHAIAEQRDAARWPDDALRPLTVFGRDRFTAAAQGLAMLVPTVDLVLSSPYARALQTAVLLEAEAGWPQPQVASALAADAPIHSALALLRGSESERAIACVGHEPTLSMLVQALLRPAHAEDAPRFKKGGAMCLRFRGRIEPGKGRLAWACAPKTLRELVR